MDKNGSGIGAVFRYVKWVSRKGAKLKTKDAKGVLNNPLRLCVKKIIQHLTFKI
jgi:hypothetical protein